MQWKDIVDYELTSESFYNAYLVTIRFPQYEPIPCVSAIRNTHIGAVDAAKIKAAELMSEIRVHK